MSIVEALSSTVGRPLWLMYAGVALPLTFREFACRLKKACGRFAALATKIIESKLSKTISKIKRFLFVIFPKLIILERFRFK